MRFVYSHCLDLVKAGADITELNNVRRCLSQVKNGKLANRAIKAGFEVITFLISDIIGDPVGLIASGPTVVDVETNNNNNQNAGLVAHRILQKYNIAVDVELKRIIDDENNDTSLDLKRLTNLIIGNNTVALNAGKV